MVFSDHKKFLSAWFHSSKNNKYNKSRGKNNTERTEQKISVLDDINHMAIRRYKSKKKFEKNYQQIRKKHEISDRLI